ncbi:calcium-binding protein [Stenotrophomonas rhizophila]|nr:calcium-binding protein [Stenotrophomonas rhizophila]
MNNASLAASLFQQLQQGQGLQQVSQQLGIEPAQASSAVGAALPLLLGAMGRNAQQPQGADALLGALQRDHAPAAGGGFDLGGLLGSVLGGGGGNATNGAGILGHVFGGNSDRAAQGLSQATGLDSSKTSQLLAILAPIVMSYLAQRFANGGNAGQLTQALGQEAEAASSGGLLTSVLDQDGDGQLGIGDLLKLGGGLLGKR